MTWESSHELFFKWHMKLRHRRTFDTVEPSTPSNLRHRRTFDGVELSSEKCPTSSLSAVCIRSHGIFSFSSQRQDWTNLLQTHLFFCKNKLNQQRLCIPWFQTIARFLIWYNRYRNEVGGQHYVACSWIGLHTYYSSNNCACWTQQLRASKQIGALFFETTQGCTLRILLEFELKKRLIFEAWFLLLFL